MGWLGLFQKEKEDRGRLIRTQQEERNEVDVTSSAEGWGRRRETGRTGLALARLPNNVIQFPFASLCRAHFQPPNRCCLGLKEKIQTEARELDLGIRIRSLVYADTQMEHS